MIAVKPISKYSAVLLPAEEGTDADGSESPRWIPVEENDQEFYEEAQEPQTKKAKKTKLKQKKVKTKEEGNLY